MATHKHIAELSVKHRRNTLSEKRKPYAVAITYMAVIGCLLFTGIALYPRLQKGAGKKNVATNGQVLEEGNALAPDVHRVQLKLANGRIVYLDSNVNGHIALQYRSVIYKRGNLVRYEWSNGDAQPELEYNTITTPRTRTFILELPDGSKAWLNASSSITFPTAFINRERIVHITGEVYFEVNPNPVTLGAGQQKKPFIVYVNPLPGSRGAGAMIEVMGTHFNINGYGDEPVIKTTVLQGKVRVSNRFRQLTHIGGATNGSQAKAAEQPEEQLAVLIPGQQAQVNGDGQLEVIKYADIQEVMAWHRDLLIFNDLEIKQIMQQLCRQYDYEVEYKEPVTGHYTLSMTRQSTIEQVLNVLELAGGVNFDIDGHKIIVSQ